MKLLEEVTKSKRDSRKYPISIVEVLTEEIRSAFMQKPYEPDKEWQPTSGKAIELPQRYGGCK